MSRRRAAAGAVRSCERGSLLGAAVESHALCAGRALYEATRRSHNTAHYRHAPLSTDMVSAVAHAHHGTVVYKSIAQGWWHGEGEGRLQVGGDGRRAADGP